MSQTIAHIQIIRDALGNYGAIIEHVDAGGRLSMPEGVGEFRTVGALLSVIGDSVRDALKDRPQARELVAVDPALDARAYVP